MNFTDLPLNYQNAINKSIHNWLDDSEIAIANAFKESITEELFECEIHETDDLPDDWFDTQIVWFFEGWKAREKVKQSAML